MGDFLHRITKQHLISTSPNDLLEPIGKYISNPDLSAVQGFSSIYWKITGDVVSLMSPPERAAVDTARRSASRDNEVAGFVDDAENTSRQFIKVMISEINTLRQLHGLPPINLAQVRNQLRSGLGT